MGPNIQFRQCLVTLHTRNESQLSFRNVGLLPRPAFLSSDACLALIGCDAVAAVRLQHLVEHKVPVHYGANRLRSLP